MRPPRRPVFTAAAALLLAAWPASAETNKSCLVCHTTPLFDPEALPKSVHGKLACADCHEGYKFTLHKEQPPERSAEDKALLAKLAKESPAPDALLACAKCHESAKADWLASVHGRWLREERTVAGPTCASCHGNPHSIPLAKFSTPNQRHKDAAARCTACHENPELVKKAGLSPLPGPSFRDSVHGRLLALGSDKAPVCFNCHGSHEIAPVKAEESMVSAKNKVSTCAECHKGATENFATTFTHKHWEKTETPIPYWTHVFFSWLTSLTLTFLFLHVLVDFAAEARRWNQKRKGGQPVSHGHSAAGHETVVRFSKHQLVQHWALIVSVLTLVVSGWPLRAAQVGPSVEMTTALGGLAGQQWIHRVAGALMIAAAVYHLAWLTTMIFKRRLVLSMLPAPRDLRDMLQNFAFFLGKAERPRFDTFSYAEKFDYWAVFWGVAIMAGTGFVRWFPVWFGKWMPAGLIQACQIAHGEEATLAALALFVWHLYNVHLRPSIFPMSWIWVDGRITVEALQEEHADEWTRMQEEKAAAEKAAAAAAATAAAAAAAATATAGNKP